MVEPWVGALTSDLGFRCGKAETQTLLGDSLLCSLLCRPSNCRPCLPAGAPHSFGAGGGGGGGGPGQPKGEIEVFVTRAGHKTGFHTDYQENFTVQLRGKKRWLLARSELASPLRAFTPHYRGDNDIEQQLKCHRLQVRGVQPYESETTQCCLDSLIPIVCRLQLPCRCRSRPLARAVPGAYGKWGPT
eukprot:SAG22_NODE_2386_length_2627_cov_4.058544_4_plen_188_part_00